MTQTRTLTPALKSLPVRSVKVSVLAGPDAGKMVEPESDRLMIGTATDNELVLTDPTVSRYHLEVQCREGEIHLVDHDSTNGTFAGEVRLLKAIAPPGAVLRLGQSTVRIDESASRLVELVEGDRLASLLGKSAAMRRVMALVARAAPATAPVLIVGESGTGKELVASALHESSARHDGPFVVVDCGALSPTLVASELFGHERGAFTGAERQHAGAFERANGGTLFLDEIGELPDTLQPMLLGVLERKRFRRVGGQTELPTDVRLVAATHRDLRSQVNAGKFRLDLYYRLNVVRIDVPPLRDRVEDIPVLVEHFLAQLGARAPVLSPEIQARLRAHRWPGNVRELKNFVEATVALGELPPLEVGASHAAGGSDYAALELLTYKDARARLLESFEAHYVGRVLERAGGNVAKAARLADVDRSYLHELIRRRGRKPD